MIKLLKWMVMAVARLAEKAFQAEPPQRCVRGASAAARAARRREAEGRRAGAAAAESPEAMAAAKL